MLFKLLTNLFGVIGLLLYLPLAVAQVEDLFIDQIKMHASIYSSPAITSSGQIFFADSDGNLTYAAIEDGKLRVIDTYKTNAPMSSSPAISSEGVIYVGSQDHFLYAFQIDRKNHLELIDRFETKLRVVSSPTISSNGVVYFGAEDHYLYAVKLSPEKKLTLISKYKTGGGLFSSPLIDGHGRLYQASKDSSLYVFKIMPSGELLFLDSYYLNQAKTEPLGIFSTPTVDSKGRIYIPGGDQALYVLQFNPSNRLELITRSKVLGELDITSFEYSSPVMGPNDELYFVAHSFSKSPSSLKEFKSHAWLHAVILDETSGKLKVIDQIKIADQASIVSPVLTPDLSLYLNYASKEQISLARIYLDSNAKLNKQVLYQSEAQMIGDMPEPLFSSPAYHPNHYLLATCAKNKSLCAFQLNTPIEIAANPKGTDSFSSRRFVIGRDRVKWTIPPYRDYVGMHLLEKWRELSLFLKDKLSENPTLPQIACLLKVSSLTTFPQAACEALQCHYELLPLNGPWYTSEVSSELKSLIAEIVSIGSALEERKEVKTTCDRN